MKLALIHFPVIVLALSLVTFAEDSFEIPWSSVDGGGAMRSSGGAFVLSGTVGQPDAGSMIGGTFSLTGGFWFELLPGDCDSDGVLGLSDHQLFLDCLDGPGVEVGNACTCFEVEFNGAIDLTDFAENQNNFNGT